jgi:hypothetical protein
MNENSGVLPNSQFIRTLLTDQAVVENTNWDLVIDILDLAQLSVHASDESAQVAGRVLAAAMACPVVGPHTAQSGDGTFLNGPHPLVPGEGCSVQYFSERRALAKLGTTGLWQVSGRSDVSAEERFRLDHLYVDNWSPVQDVSIVGRTVRTVDINRLASPGAHFRIRV